MFYNIANMNAIYYFSGTGNCLAISKQIAEISNDVQVTAITRELVGSISEIQADSCIIVFPAYAYGLPSLVRQFLKKTSIKANYLVLVVSYASKYGGALAQGKRMLRRSGCRANYFCGIKCVENYIPMFGFPKQEVLEKRQHMQHDLTENLKANIISRKNNDVRTFRPITGLVSVVFRFVKPVFAKLYKVTPKCNGCGLCASICPSAAITMSKKNRPKFTGRKCDHCQGCLNLCPQKAIHFVRLGKRCGRYHHPDIGISELKKR